MIKKRIIFGLITLGVFIPSFSSAINQINAVSFTEDLGGNSCTINSSYIFDCSNTNHVLVGQGDNLSSSFWWRNDGLGFYTYNGYYPERALQGVITEFSFCEYDFIGSNSLRIGDPASLYWPSSCFTATYTYQELLDYFANHELKGWGVVSYYNAGTAGPVWIFEDGAFRANFDIGSSYQSFQYGYYELQNFNLAGLGFSADYSNVGVVANPLSNYKPPLPDTPVPDWNNSTGDLTNCDILSGYNVMGLTDEFCYGGFPINNIFNSGELPQNFTGYRRGGGANILDIWDIYSGAYNNDPVSFIRSFYVAYENNNYSSFYGYPKALYGFFNQYFMVSNDGLGFWGSALATFTPMSIWEYCNLRFKSDCNATYTGNSRDPQFAWRNRDLGSNEGKFNFSGNNGFFSGSLSGFENPTDFFGSLNAIFQGGLGDIGYRAPLLPSYILVFLFAIILIRMLSH